MSKRFLIVASLASTSLACATQPHPSGNTALSASAQSPAHEELPILVNSVGEAEKYPGKVVQVRGRSVSFTLGGATAPALELSTGGIVVLEPKGGATVAEVQRALAARPLGGRFYAIGKIQPTPSDGSQGELATMTLEGLPSANLAATPDEINVGVWPASTPSVIAVAPMVQIPLGGKGYRWWSLSRDGEGVLFLEADALGRNRMKLDEPIEMVNEVVPLDADGDSLYELALSLTTKSGKKQSIVVGADGARIEALERKLGSATTADEIYEALGTYNWPAILSGPNGVEVARVFWDEESLGAVQPINLRISGMRFFMAEELMTKDGAGPDTPMLRVRAENKQSVVDVRCGNTWKTVDQRDPPANAPMLPTVLAAARETVEKNWSEVRKVCVK